MLRFVAGFLIVTLLSLVATPPADAQRLCGILDGPGCVPNVVCGILEGPDCIQDGQFAVSGNFQVTIGTAVSADAKMPSGELNTLLDLAAALRACWKPPADNVLAGMQMSARFAFNRSGQLIGRPRMTYATSGASARTRTVYLEAIANSLDGCTPLKFTRSFAAAIAGRPISVRIVDDRAPQRASML